MMATQWDAPQRIYRLTGEPVIAIPKSDPGKKK